MRCGIVLLFLTAVLVRANLARADSPNDILIIANQKVSVSLLTKNEVRQLFLKQRTRWASGQDCIPIHAAKGSELRKAFSKRVLRMAEHEEKTHWNEQQVRLGMRAPPEFKSKSLQKAVFNIKGSVSYVFRKDYIPNVTKVLFVFSR